MTDLNVFEDAWDERPGHDHPGYDRKFRWVGDHLGAKGMGGSVYELPPGQKSFPYHWHHGLEEMMVVLHGEPTLRTPDGEQKLRRGDVVSFVRGPDGAHQVRNDSDKPVRYLMLSTAVDYEIAQYPDSNKIGLRTKDMRLIVRPESGVDYYDGEP